MNRRQFLSVLAASAPAGALWGSTTPPSSPRELALGFLLKRQKPDGSWRSTVYGGFRSGAALTPLVALAVSPLDPEAAARAVEWMLEHMDECLAAYPVHNACYLLQLSQSHKPLVPKVPSLCKRLLSLQLGSRLGWKPDHRAFGGWGYFGLITPWKDGTILAPMQESNLSPTVFAVTGLRAGGVPVGDPAIREAAAFIRKCQNHRDDRPAGEFDDGGFFQMLGDAHRNKAGVAGVDADGAERYRSYSAATGDGIRGLLLTGGTSSDPRVKAAIGWMRKHPGTEDLAHLRFYAAWSRRETEKILHTRFPGETLAVAQNEDGSWINPAGEYREDDPLIATAMALMALDQPKKTDSPGS